MKDKIIYSGSQNDLFCTSFDYKDHTSFVEFVGLQMSLNNNVYKQGKH